MSSFFGRFLQWQFYVHYLLLSVIFYFWVQYGHTISWTGYLNGWFGLIIFYLIGLFVAGTVVHLLFWFLPKPWRWRS